MRQITVLTFSLILLVCPGCKKQVKCDPADSKAVCNVFQECLRSDTSTEVCRIGEQDANKVEKANKP